MVAAVSKPGPKNLITDISGLKVGNSSDENIKTGTTVLVGDVPFTASVLVMGGAPGTKETDLLAPDKSMEDIDALVLSGGSAFGLDACSGVMDGLRKSGRGFPVGAMRVPIVPGAIIFDLINGGKKDWTENPYRALGLEAFNSRSKDFEVGTVGAGAGALAAMQKGGLGSVSLKLENGYTVGALVVVNPFGSVTTSGGKHFWAAPFEFENEFGGAGIDSSPGPFDIKHSPKNKAMKVHSDQISNTTIAIVATDAPLSKTQCYRMAVAAHDGMVRAIVPSHTLYDGDLVFALSTKKGEIDHETFRDIGVASAVCLSRAIARGVYEATTDEDDILPTYKKTNCI
jgi:L-aminopeptidase/D-esterase-like protein